jgi:4'-phosphopantetheinyl transferase EntD
METILPPPVVTAELLGEDVDAFLLPEEEAVLGQVAEKRSREFMAGRTCARRALARLGMSPVPILPGPSRQPLWPRGVVGSITHCPGYTAAAVSFLDRMATIGIDAEPHAALPYGVLDKVSREEERAWVRLLSGTGICWDRVLFCAKEAVYKAWFPIVGVWLGFEDALITVNPESGTFHARLRVPGPTIGDRTITGFDGRYVVVDELVLAAVTVSARR